MFLFLCSCCMEDGHMLGRCFCQSKTFWRSPLSGTTTASCPQQHERQEATRNFTLILNPQGERAEMVIDGRTLGRVLGLPH